VTPPEKPPIPEPIAGTLWTSKWDSPRTLKAGDIDPQDPKLQLLKVGDIAPTAIIGNGECRLTGSSPRLYISAPNKEVEFSAEVFVGNNLEIAHLIARSNHEDRPDGFGGYYLYVNFAEQKMYFKKEETHVLGYSPRLAETSINFDKNRWHKMSMRVMNTPDGNVSIQGVFDDRTIVELDQGQLKGKPFIDTAKWCFIRTNKPDDVRYRNVEVKEI
jgi:hypothetical protein